MDLSTTIQPKSDQLNADSLIPGPVTVTIREVTEGTQEQPANLHLVEYPGRAYRPSLSMRRVLVALWGKDASTYAGRRLTLYRNPNTKFGRDVVGGIEISHLSHIDRRATVMLTVTRGQKKPFHVEPLVEQQAAPAPPSPRNQMFELLTEQGMTEKEPMLAYVSETLGRDVQSSQELTDDDVTTILTRLTTLEN
ncbi:hypothetical protein [Brachybacterium alimentarium]|uniref:hypothetical protein n=1 Tax=Brachybacterium alimentarium TaxID=47845 RepID=UPI000DF1102A|nr:hypothetical protein [Brachybacterium alimentarium]RCS81831.1 hypothetical protein CIK67_15655 [Brachybacterium alimentarium]